MAATALPRFMDVTTEAHASVVNGVHSGLQSGAALYHATWVAEGQPTASSAITDYGSLRTTPEGYPYGTVDNSATVDDVVNNVDCSAIFTNVLQVGAPSITTGVATFTNDFATQVTGDDCIYYYTAEYSTTGDTVQTLTFDTETGAVTAATAALP